MGNAASADEAWNRLTDADFAAIEARLLSAEITSFARTHAPAIREMLLGLPDYSPSEVEIQRYHRVTGIVEKEATDPSYYLDDHDKRAALGWAKEVTTFLPKLRYITSVEFLTRLDSFLEILQHRMDSIKETKPDATFGTYLDLGHIIGPSGAGAPSAVFNWQKSNTMVTLLALDRLRLDVVAPSEDANSLSSCTEVYVFDDCSYSGQQLTQTVSRMRSDVNPHTYGVVMFAHDMYNRPREIHRGPISRYLLPEFYKQLELDALPFGQTSPLTYKPFTMTYLQFKMPDFLSIPEWVWKLNPFDRSGVLTGGGVAVHLVGINLLTLAIHRVRRARRLVRPSRGEVGSRRSQGKWTIGRGL
jgi:hypothetical protein